MPDRQKPTSAPRLSWRQREAREIRVAVVDPQLVAPGTASPSVYEQDVLLVSPAAPPEFSLSSQLLASRVNADAVESPSPLHAAAARLGWTLEPEPLEDAPGTQRGADRAVPEAFARSAEPDAVGAPTRSPGAAQTIRMRIGLDPTVGPEVPQVPPDAWRLIVEARKAGATGIGLNHIMTTDALGANPFTGNPFTGNPFTGNPFTGNPFTGNAGGMAGYAVPGFGGRQPVAYVGAPLPAATLKDADRPVVAILDTGCGTHPWLANAVIDPVAEYGGPIGIDDPATDPDVFPAQGSPLDGLFGPAAGHGTFIAGVVLQSCPEVRILPVRVADAQGVIVENDLLAAVGRLVELVESGRRIDVVNMSFSYYHETPEAQTVNSELYSLLVRLRAKGTVIVCSAGNDATDRPSSPASLYDWGPDSGITAEGDIAPLVTVGALNPSGDSLALFSNIGEWVQTYVRGVSVISILPTTFEGSVQPDISSDEYGRRRETLDIDDYRDGFAVWSGTSFAAPLVAGRIAAKLAGPVAAKPVDAACAARDEVLKVAASQDRSVLVP